MDDDSYLHTVVENHFKRGGLMRLTWKQLEALSIPHNSTPIDLNDPEIKSMIAECRKPHSVQMELEDFDDGC